MYFSYYRWFVWLWIVLSFRVSACSGCHRMSNMNISMRLFFLSCSWSHFRFPKAAHVNWQLVVLFICACLVIIIMHRVNSLSLRSFRCANILAVLYFIYRRTLTESNILENDLNKQAWTNRASHQWISMPKQIIMKTEKKKIRAKENIIFLLRPRLDTY